MVFFVGLTYAELTSALSRAGGELSFTYLGIGPRASFVCGWTLLLAYVSVGAFEAVALPMVIGYVSEGFQSGYLYSVAGWDVHLSWVVPGVAGAVGIGIINYMGIRPAAPSSRDCHPYAPLDWPLVFHTGETSGEIWPT